MAKVFKTIGAVASVAAMIPGPWQPFAQAIAVAANIGTALTAKKPGAEGQVQGLIVGANNPLPYLMGQSYTEGVELYRTGYGGTVSEVENPYAFLPRVLSCCGPIQSMGATQVDYQDVTLTGAVGSVQPVAAGGWFADYLFVDQRLGARPEATALAVPAGWGTPTNWSAAHKLSGMASVGWSLKWDKNAKRWSGGSVPPLGKVPQGVKVYDPRLDSTFPGGSGSQRLNDETTWAYSANPALHAATYAYGRKVNSVPVFGGRLFDVNAIDFTDVVPWANVCDANGWTVNGTIYEPGDKWDNLKLICEAGGGVPVLRGGVLGFDFQAPRTSLYTVTRDDLASATVSGRLGKGWKERHNTLTPRFRSPAHQWTYQQATAVSVSAFVTADGEEKSDERQWDLVTDKDQVTELAMYDLYQRREAGPFTILCKPHMQIFRPGDCLTLAAELGLHPSGAVVAVVRQWRLEPNTGAVELVLEQETSAKHAAALGATGAVAAAAAALPTSQAMDQAWGANARSGINTFITGIATAAALVLVSGTTLASGLTVTRASAATRVNASGLIESVAAGNPRWDYDTSGNLRGLLLEEGRTNIRTFSEDFTDATWKFANSTTTVGNATTAPDGTATADKLVEAAATQQHRTWGYSGSWATTNGATYADSIFLKDAGRGFAQIVLAYMGTAVVNIDLATGATNTVSAGTSSGVAVTSFPGGWWRLTITGTSNGTIGHIVINTVTSLAAANGQSYNGNGTSGIYVWGAQLEAGAFATSYIPSTGATSTARAAEYAEISGTALTNYFTAAQGALVIEMDTATPGTTTTAVDLYATAGSNASALRLGLAAAAQADFYSTAAASVASFDHGTPVANTLWRQAVAWANNDFASSANGSAALTDLAGTYGTTANKLRLGQRGDGSLPLNGHVKSLALWNTRLVNADLLTLSGETAVPTATGAGDIWISRGEGNRQRRWSGTAWVDVQDTAIGTAQATADGKNKIFPASASAPVGAVAGDLWPDTSGGATVTRRYDGVSTWTLVSTVGATWSGNIVGQPSDAALLNANQLWSQVGGTGRPADDATVGAPAGTNVGSTAAATVEAGANAANAGVNSDGTIKSNKVGTPAIVDGAITLPFIIRQSGTQVMGLTSGTAQAITGLSFSANIATSEVLDLEFVHQGVWSGTDGTRFSIDGDVLRDGVSIITFATIFDTNDMATNNQGGFAFPISVSERIVGNGSSSTYSVTLTLRASTNESNSGGSKTYVAPLDFRVRGGILRGRRYNSK